MKKSLLLSLLAIFCLFTLQSQTVEFSDDFESGTSKWVLQGTWGTTTTQAYTGSRSLTDSPNGNYAANLNISATMANGVDLTNALDATLSFWAIYSIENGNFDYCYVEASGNGGTTWVNIATIFGEGNLTPWTQYTYSLGGFVGNSNVKVRFRLFTDGGYEVDGIYIDDVEITSSNEDLSPPLILFDPPKFYYSTLGHQEFLPEIVDVSGVDYASLWYTVDGGTLTQGGYFGNVGGDQYSLVIPEQAPGSQVDFYIEAVDLSNNANKATTPTYSYIAGNHVLYDNGEVDFVQSFGPSAQSGLLGCAVRFSLFGKTDIVYALIRNYTDPNRPNNQFQFHIWENNNGLPGADLITPFMVTPEANLVITSPMTRVDLSPYLAELSDINGDVFMGFTVPSGQTWLGQTTPAVGGRTYIFNGTSWGINTGDDYHFRLVTSEFTYPDDCVDAADLTGLMGQGMGSPQTSTPFDNTDASTGIMEPSDGFDCFIDASLENTLWYTFVGDGLAYQITTTDCAGTGGYLLDTQIAVYEGNDCGSLTPVACNDDVDYYNYVAAVTVETQPGVTYFMLIDGYGGETGDYCVQFEEMAIIDCDDIAIGDATGEMNVCFGETTSFQLSAGTVIPGNGPILGFLWSVHGEDVSGSPDPFNEPSWLGNFGQVFTVDNIYTPQLVNNGTNLPAGTYYFTPIVFGGGQGAGGTPWPDVDFSTGCILTGNSVEVNLLPQLDPLVNDIVTVDETIGMMDGEASVTTTGGTGSYSYEWSNGATTATVTGLSAGTYTVTITDDSGCLEEVETVVINEFVNAEERAFQQALSIQPNPTNGRTFVNFNFQEAYDLSISILNPVGQLVEKFQVGLVREGQFEMNVGQLPQGVYLIDITNGEHHAMKRLVVTSK